MIPCPPVGPRSSQSRARPILGGFPKQDREGDSATEDESTHTSLPDPSTMSHNSLDSVVPTDSIDSSVACNRNDGVKSSTPTSGFDRDWVRRNMMDCFEALAISAYHVALVDEQVAQGVSRLVRDVQGSDAAIICICSLSQQLVAKRFLKSLASRLKGSRGIVMVCADEGKPFDPEEVLDATSAFYHLGASDTVLQRSRGRKLLLDVTLSVQRSEANLARIWKELKRKKQVIDSEKFWPHCHEFIEGFPQLDNYRPRLTVGSLVASRLILSEVSHGSFGTIFKCLKRSNGTFEALKVVPKSKLKGLPQVKAMGNELSLTQMLNHPNVVKLHDAIHVQEHIIIMMEFAGNVSLSRYIRDAGLNFDKAHAGDILCQLVAGVAHCHHVGVAHRDLKPENLVVMDDRSQLISLKIVDFGCAIESTKACTDACGTIPFIAPEVFLKEADECYNPACVDMWACGVIFLEMLCGLHKIDNMLQLKTSSLDKLTYAIQVKSLFTDPHTAWQHIAHHIPASCHNVLPGGPKPPLLGMLDVSPTLRWNAAQVQSWARPWAIPR